MTTAVADAPSRALTTRPGLLAHAAEYAIEAGALATFMFSACTFTVLLEHPASPLHSAIPSPFARRALTGVAMALTALLIIYSPWGKRSGAHMNPALTVTFYRLGKVARRDLAGYLLAHFSGALFGVASAAAFFGGWLEAPTVRYAATLPGQWGIAPAFIAELIISFVLMLVVLTSAASKRWARYTGLFAGALIFTYILLEAPLSGMSMNPARTVGSAAFAQSWTALWIYLTAPLLGMLSAAEVYLWRRGRSGAPCAKLRHLDGARCIFCEFVGTKSDRLAL